MKTCFAGYNTRGAKVQDGDDFGRMWYAYDNSTQVEAVINKTLSDADEFPPTAEQVHARKIIMDGFQFDNHTKAGIYRGRLSNLYEYDLACDCCVSCDKSSWWFVLTALA